MLKFCKDVDKRSRTAMTDYLLDHFRYYTANSWNKATSYAHNLKIHGFGFADEIAMNLYSLVQCEEFYAEIAELLRDFAAEYNWLWQAGFNGRSGGYLVLYQGERKPSGYKSYCPYCGQLNYSSVAENSGKCGICKKDRKDFSSPHLVINMFTGRGIDQYEDFEDWGMRELKEQVALVQRFDRLADDIVAKAVYLANKFTVEQEEYSVTKIRPVMVMKGAVA